jgi:hypothetical protein
VALSKKPRQSAPLKPPEPIPAHVLEFDTLEFNPTAVGMGNYGDLGDSTHFVDEATLEGLAAGDLPHWSAFDELVVGLVRARQPTLDDETVKARLVSIKKVVDGTRRGSPKTADDALLFAVAHALVRKRLQSNEAEPSIRATIIQLVDSEYWNGHYATEKKETVYRRIKRKYVEDEARLLAMVTAASHPLQRERWNKMQEALALLRSIGVAK